ncbi:MAG: flagellar protein FliT [Gammaproteobacteria bacterium]|nr:flagellar protein FliT [Gammaproteobacteria bacterium]
MKPQRQQQWQAIIQLTQKMRQLAVPNESLSDLAVDEEYAKQPWQRIAELDHSRLALLKKFFASPVSTEEAGELAEGIKQIQSIDHELLNISQSIKNEIGTVFSKIGDAKHAISAYSSNS